LKSLTFGNVTYCGNPTGNKKVVNTNGYNEQTSS
jgi:hypothetical protein